MLFPVVRAALPSGRRYGFADEHPRTALAAAGLLLPLAAFACSSTHGPAPSTTTTCGYLYTLHISTGVTRIGECAGTLSPSSQEVTVRSGETFDIDSVTEAASGLPDMTAPVSTDPRVVALVQVSGHGGNGRYRAVTVGMATLVTSSIYCNGGPVDSTATTRVGSPPLRVCPVIRVQVTA